MQNNGFSDIGSFAIQLKWLSNSWSPEFHRGPFVTETMIRDANVGGDMEQKYWLDRKRASVVNAEQATSSEARLIHLDLAGRYSVKAADEKNKPEG
ncbi:MAG TPA: hypothetical protein VK485_01600 [Sphingomicrobium sp.]|nr:hypothetical protein [Sphingomicrobium sp.]